MLAFDIQSPDSRTTHVLRRSEDITLRTMLRKDTSIMKLHPSRSDSAYVLSYLDDFETCIRHLTSVTFRD